MRDFLIAPDILSRHTCNALAAVWAASPDLYSPETDPFWGNRILRYEAIRSHAPEICDLMMFALAKSMGLITEFYAEGALYCDGLNLVGWPAPHPGMPLHSDNSYADGKPHALAHRAYSGVIYLTDDYEGGELFILSEHNKQTMLKPPIGTLVSLPGGLTHQHGVAPVSRGSRVTIAFFLTRHPDKAVILGHAA